jgi:hypothetical protein
VKFLLERKVGDREGLLSLNGFTALPLNGERQPDTQKATAKLLSRQRTLHSAPPKRKDVAG